MTVITRKAFYEEVLRGDKKVIKSLPYYLISTDLGEMVEPVDAMFGTQYLGTTFSKKDVHEFLTAPRGHQDTNGTTLFSFAKDLL